MRGLSLGFLIVIAIVYIIGAKYPQLAQKAGIV